MAQQHLKMIDVSLTRSCNYDCSYCNQRYDYKHEMFDMKDNRRIIVKNNRREAEEWIRGLNNFPWKDQYQRIIFSGGEPSVHKGFYDIVTQVNGFKQTLIVTNLSFDVDRLIRTCEQQRKRLIVQPSFHFEFSQFDEFLEKLKALRQANMLSNFTALSIVELPDRPEVYEYARKFREAGFIPSTYLFEGYYKGKWYYADRNGYGGQGAVGTVTCSSAVHYVRPNGDVVFCATDTYENEPPAVYGNICDMQYVEIPVNRHCGRYGVCHISCASWSKVTDEDDKRVLWHGKNHLRRTGINRLRVAVERRNYRWVGTVKRAVMRIRDKLGSGA